MSQRLFLGGIDKETNEYVYPKIADKTNQYICPECDTDLILCKGQIKAPHFRHRKESVRPCKHYSSPTETQTHNDAKLRLKKLIEMKNIKINSTCEKM